MDILLTGASGFIGARLVRRLRADGHEVVTIGRQLVGGGTHVLVDLASDFTSVKLPSKVDAVIHLAALIHPEGSEGLRRAVDINVRGTMELLRYAGQAGASMFVYGSTAGVLGCGDTPLRESDPFRPMDLYGLTKAQAELAVQSDPGPFEKVVLRYAFPYGRGTPNPLPGYADRVKRGEPIEVIHRFSPRMNPIYVDDAVEAMMRALSLEGSHVLNIAGEEVTTIPGFCLLVGRMLDTTPIFRLVQDGNLIPYYRHDLVVSTERSRGILGPYWSISLEEGIRRLLSGQ